MGYGGGRAIGRGATRSQSFRVGFLFCSEAFHPLAANHASDTEDDERNAQLLPDVQSKGGFLGHLYLLRVLDEETEGEDVSKTKPEVKTCAYADSG